MKNKRIMIISLALISLFVILMMSIFKFVEVPDIKWTQNYSYESKEAYGGFLFKSMVEELYGEDKVRSIKGEPLDSLEERDQLYIYFGNSYYYPEDRMDSLRKFLEAGNQAIFISSDIEFPQEDSIYNPYYYMDMYKDSIISYSNCQQLYNEDVFNIWNFDHELDSLKKIDYYLSNPLDLEYDSVQYNPILCASDTGMVFFTLEEPNLYFHVLPQSFVNISSRQDDFLDHFNFVFSHFDAKEVVLDHPSFHGSYSIEDKQSPIQYVLDTPPLAWAYYLTIATMGMFILFGSKRKQKAIPLVQKNKNTSLEYVNVLSQIFLKQEQNHKLANHMKENFEHEIKRKYFIDIHREDFIDLLSKKSKVESDRIRMMYRLFDRAKEDSSMSDFQLSQLYSHIDYFHKNAQ